MKLEDFVPGECYFCDGDLFIIDSLKEKDDYYELEVKERISNKIDTDTSGYIIAFAQSYSAESADIDKLKPFNKEIYYKIRKLISINTNTINEIIKNYD